MALDRQSAGAYADALARQPERRDDLRRDLLRWLKQRDAACALPSRAVADCLDTQITARIGALALSGVGGPGITAPGNTAPGPAVSGSTVSGSTVSGSSVPGPAAATVPPAMPLPDPAIPAGADPGRAAATLEQTSLSPAEQGETLLHVTTAGRFTLAVKSPGGTALQLVDMLTGPSEVAGAAGSQDGRLDLLLDAGVYKVRLFPAKDAAGPATLGVVPFRDAAPPVALPQPGQPLAATLRDGEQRAFWLSVPPSGAVRIEAAGRSLADLRLWRDGRELSALEPVVTVVEPVPGRPLTDMRLVGTVEPGTYLAVAYGGPATTWTASDTAQPFHLRAGASDALEAGWAGGPIGPFGSEIYALPASTALLRLRLPAAAPAMLVSGTMTAAIARDSREPVASLAVPPGRQPVVEVRAAAGQAFTLRALEQPASNTLGRPGTFWVAAVANGAGGDEVPATVLLERGDGSDRPPAIVADTLPQVGPDGWHTRFNLRGPTTVLTRSAGGPVAVRTEGVPVRTGPVNADVPGGVYALSLAPQRGGLGALDLVVAPPGGMPALVPPVPPDPVLPLGIQTVAPGARLTLLGNTAPGLSLGLLARPVPVALAEGPLTVTVPAHAGLTVPVLLAPGGTLAVTEVGVGPAPSARQDEAGQSRVTILPSEHARTVVLAWRRTPVMAAAIPAPGPDDAAMAMQAGTPVFFDLARDAPRGFALGVAQGGLFRIETLGRLHTSGRLSTPFIPRLAGAEANGVGQNMLMETMLRAGRYRVQVTAQDSEGHAGLVATPAPQPTLAELRPGGSVRATLPAGGGATIPLVIEAPQRVHLDVASLGAPWQGRLEDEAGWPLTRSGPLDGIERALPAGRYRLLVEPAPVTRQVVARLRPVVAPVAIAGHGPHALPFGVAQAATWREPDSQQAARTPDRWFFGLAGTAEVTLRLGDAMVGELHGSGQDQAGRRIIRQFKGRLEAGQYQLDVTSLGRNDRAEYTVALDAAELQPDTPRLVSLPATLPFAIAAPRVVSLTSFGGTPVKAVLRDQAGKVVGRHGPRADDWNIAVSRPLPAGAYMLDLRAADAPDTTDTPRRDASGNASGNATDASATEDSSGDGRPGGSDSDDDAAPASRDDQVAQTAASQVATAAPTATPAVPTSVADDDAPTPQVEVRLSLPPALDTSPAPSATAVLAGQGVHVLAVPAPAPGSLVVARAQSAAALVLVLERQDAQGWTPVVLDEGRTAAVASPADGDARAWRVQVWTVDGGPEPIRLAARAVTVAAQDSGHVTLADMDGMPAPLAVAQVRVRVARGLVSVGGASQGQASQGLVSLSGAPEGLVAGGWPGHALDAVADGVALPQGDTLWLMGPAGSLEVAPLVPDAGRSISLSVPAGLTATLQGLEGTQFWLARSGTGQPSLGAAMGWAAGSAIALADGPVPLHGTGEDTLRLILQRHSLALAPPQAVTTALHVVLPPGGALPVTLPPGYKQLQVELPAGTGVIPDWHAPRGAIGAASGTAMPVVLWAGDAAVSRTVQGGWTELLLVNAGPAAAAVSLAVSPAPPALGLVPGSVLKRFFGAAGSFEVAVQGGPDARLVLAGPASVTVIGEDGQVSQGRSLAVPGRGRAVVSHQAGAVALWMQSAAASPWPVAAAQPVQAPARLALSGPAAAFALQSATSVLLHAGTTAPVLLGLVQPGRTDAPALFPAGADLHRMLAAGTAELRLYPPQDGPLTGTLFLRTEPILPVAEGLGAPVSVPPGGAAAFGFTLTRAATIGLGVRSEPDRALARLLDATGRVVGDGVAQLAALQPGRYVLEVQVPADAPTTVLRPAIVGITPRGNGPPPDVARTYLELAGMKPQETRP